MYNDCHLICHLIPTPFSHSTLLLPCPLLQCGKVYGKTKYCMVGQICCATKRVTYKYKFTKYHWTKYPVVVSVCSAALPG